MAILTRNEIKKAIDRGFIKIEPLDGSQIGAGSVDLTLGNEFRIFKKHRGIFHIRDCSNFEGLTEFISLRGGETIIVKPQEMILGITKEKITLAENYCGWLEGRSRFARFGLVIHVTAGFVHPGTSNHQVLEIVNLGHTRLALYPGTRICQFILEKCIGRAKYTGKFEVQDKP
jgi:dCTP deaminase